MITKILCDYFRIKKSSKYLLSTKNRTIFAVFNNQRDMVKTSLTEKEFDLIEAIRNYKKSYPNGYPEIRWYIEKIFNELMAEAENETD